MDWEAAKNYVLPLVATGLAGYAVYEASERYPKALAAGAGVLVGLGTAMKISD